VVHLHSSLSPTHDVIPSRLFRNVHHHGHGTAAAYGCLKPAPASRLRRVLLHLRYSIALHQRVLDTTPHRSVRAELPHTAPTSDFWRRNLSAHTCQTLRHADPVLCRGVRPWLVFSSAGVLPSTLSAASAGCSVALFEGLIGVGSEVARLRAGHRPPLKPYVRFSRIRLSRRH